MIASDTKTAVGAATVPSIGTASGKSSEETTCTNGRVEDREYADHERKQSNNGLQEAVEFLEYIYDLDLGKSWASGCWQSPATVSGADGLADTRANPLMVSRIEECQVRVIMCTC